VPRLRDAFLYARAIFAGWVVLLLAAYAVERPLLWLIQQVAGAALAQSASIVIDLLCFAAAGWVTGRVSRPRTASSVLLFLFSLLFFDLEPLLPLHFGWVLRQISNSMADTRYLPGLIQAIVSNGMYLAAVWAGGIQSKPRPSLSISGQ